MRKIKLLIIGISSAVSVSAHERHLALSTVKGTSSTFCEETVSSGTRRKPDNKFFNKIFQFFIDIEFIIAYLISGSRAECRNTGCVDSFLKENWSLTLNHTLKVSVAIVSRKHVLVVVLAQERKHVFEGSVAVASSSLSRSVRLALTTTLAATLRSCMLHRVPSDAEHREVARNSTIEVQQEM